MKIHTVQLNLEDFDNGTSDLSPLEFGIYTRLFLASYTRDLPNDNEKLSRIARCKISEIKKCRKIIDAKFIKIENFLKNNRAEKERDRYKKISEKNKNNASERWKIKDSVMPVAYQPQTESDANRNAIAMLPNNQHLTPNNGIIKTPTPTRQVEFKKIGDLGLGVGVKKNLSVIDVIGQLQTEQIQEIQRVVNGWDIEHLAKVYVDGINSGMREAPNSIPKAFPAWCVKYTKGKKPN
jgi:uncharacterized protein YdaU (DUF1376 family)